MLWIANGGRIRWDCQASNPRFKVRRSRMRREYVSVSASVCRCGMQRHPLPMPPSSSALRQRGTLAGDSLLPRPDQSKEWSPYPCSRESAVPLSQGTGNGAPGPASSLIPSHAAVAYMHAFCCTIPHALGGRRFVDARLASVGLLAMTLITPFVNLIHSRVGGNKRTVGLVSTNRLVEPR